MLTKKEQNVFSIPCDFDMQMCEKYAQFNDTHSNCNISEVYGQITEGEFIASGRNCADLPKVDIKKLEKYIAEARKYHINFNYTLNASCMGGIEYSQYKEFTLFLHTLKNIGVNSFTIAIPSVMEIVREVIPDSQIKASAICNINCPEKAQYFKGEKIDRVVTDPDITLRFSVLRNIQKVYPNMEIIVNNMCVKNCHNKLFHYNHEAHNTVHKNTNPLYYNHECAIQKAVNDYNYIRINWIRPEDLKLYNAIGIHSFKIQGRHCHNGEKILKTMSYYASESYEGNLLDLLTLFQPYNSFQPYIDNKELDHYAEQFYENDFCTGQCEVCQYCLGYAKKSMCINDLRELNREAILFYQTLKHESSNKMQTL